MGSAEWVVLLLWQGTPDTLISGYCEFGDKSSNQELQFSNYPINVWGSGSTHLLLIASLFTRHYFSFKSYVSHYYGIIDELLVLTIHPFNDLTVY